MSNQNQTENARQERINDYTEVATAFARVGAAWARYGLGVARMGVETGAEALNITAGTLGTLADRFRKLEEPTADEEK